MVRTGNGRHNREDGVKWNALQDKLVECQQKILLYETILEHLDVGIHVINQYGETVVYNTTMSKLECCHADEMLGKHLLSAMPHLTEDTSTLFTALRTGWVLNNRQQTYINAHGQQVVTVNSTTPLQIGGKVFGALEIAKDITFIQELAETVMNLQEKLFHGEKGIGSSGHHPNTRYVITDILGESAAMKTALSYAMRAARTASSVLIYGETGTGKELFAQSIHNLSPRKNQPFIAINCAALPEQLLEGLLFGTTKGAFTGAIDRPGLFEQAGGGTLLLDELNSMNLNLQAKLLRVLQENSLRRVGAVSEVPINVRVIGTMNMEPAAAIQEKRLREDLFYRLGVMTIHTPPLRERKEDIAICTAAFIAKYNRLLGIRVQGIAAEVRDVFRRYAWPGNVRELQHAIEGAMNLIDDEAEIQFHHLPMAFRASLVDALQLTRGNLRQELISFDDRPLTDQREAMERKLIAAALAVAGDNITKAAERLGLTRQVLQYKLKKYKLK